MTIKFQPQSGVIGEGLFMTITPPPPPQEATAQLQEAKSNEKELNFRRQEAMYQRMLKEKEDRIAEIERQLAQKPRPQPDDDDDDDEPYVDKKKLERKLGKFGAQVKEETQGEIHRAVQTALKEERKQSWLKGNPDFYEVLQHADKLAEKDPEFAETILSMPDGFERQKLVYKTIKNMGMHKPAGKESSIQDKIDANRRSPYYQPSGVGASPYSQVGDFSETGQKSAYEKMQQLKKNLRLK
jgi:hypothetical protein